MQIQRSERSWFRWRGIQWNVPNRCSSREQLATLIHNNESRWPADSWQWIAVALRPRLIEAIDDLAAQGVIASVTTPTKWISSIVAASKKNVLNPKHLSHTRRELSASDSWRYCDSLHVAKVFTISKKWVLTQNLDEESSYLTTFQIPSGCYCWRRMPFGISSGVSTEDIWAQWRHVR